MWISLKRFRKAREAPEIDACLGLVEDHELRLPREDRGDLDALDLAAGEGGVHLAVKIIVGAQAHLREILAGLAPWQELLSPDAIVKRSRTRMPLKRGGCWKP